MAAMVKTSISIPKTLLDQAELLAQRLNVSRSHLYRTAIEIFLSNHQDQLDANELSGLSALDIETVTQSGARQLVINQGGIYWVQSGIPHPYVVVQDNVFTHSRINTVVVCALTSNMKRANAPGNVLLEAGEANLVKQSVVEVSKVSALDKTQLGDYIGSLSEERIKQVLSGMRFLQRSYFAGK